MPAQWLGTSNGSGGGGFGGPLQQGGGWQSPYSESPSAIQAGYANQQTIAAMPWNYKQGAFNKLFPLLSGIANQNPNQWLGTAPGLPSSTVLNGGQTQQLVNSTVAANDQTAAGNIRAGNQSLAGRGFGANSPLSAALAGQQQAAAMGQDAQARSQIPINTAQLNAQQGLGVGNLANQQYLGQLDAMNRQRTAIFGALAGLI
jgi:hypothetical protein